jgi:hypothetical protein
LLVGLRPGGQALPSVPQPPSRSCRHQLATAAWANTTSWLMPHLQAAQRRISSVVPVKSPLMRGAIRRLADGVSAAKKCAATCWPMVWLARQLPGRISRSGLSLTQRAHSAPVGSTAPGGRVRKWIGAVPGGGLGAAGGGLGAAGGGVLGDECGSGELGPGDGDCGPDADAGGVLLIAAAGVGVGTVERDAGTSVIVGSAGVLIAAAGPGLLARAWPMLA